MEGIKRSIETIEALKEAGIGIKDGLKNIASGAVDLDVVKIVEADMKINRSIAAAVIAGISPKFSKLLSKD